MENCASEETDPSGPESAYKPSFHVVPIHTLLKGQRKKHNMRALLTE